MLELKDIRKSYTAGDTVTAALDGVSLTFGKCEFVAILGTSGSGKTTLLNVIGGLDCYDSGDLIINGTSTKLYRSRDWDTYRNHSVGFVFQSYNLMPQYTALENVALPLAIRGAPLKLRNEIAEAMLVRVGLKEHIHHKPGELSGGQQQRVGIARAVITRPPIVLADEPTGNLDTGTSEETMELLTGLFRERGTTFILVSHDPGMRKYTDRTITFSDGRISNTLAEE